MDRATIDKLFAQFESCRHIDSGVELWMAKDLQTLLGYIDPRDFFADDLLNFPVLSDEFSDGDEVVFYDAA